MCEQRDEVVSSLLQMCERSNRKPWLCRAEVPSSLPLEPILMHSVTEELEEYLLKNLLLALTTSPQTLRFVFILLTQVDLSVTSTTPSELHWTSSTLLCPLANLVPLTRST